jgi:hypothetical protein
MSSAAFDIVSWSPDQLESMPIPKYHDKLAKQLRDTSYLKSLNPETRALSMLRWCVRHGVDRMHTHAESLHRPVVSGKRVTPSALRDYRLTHQFRGPCCLCPVFERGVCREYKEAAIFVATSGAQAGEYVTQCALGACGYNSKLLTP